MLLINLLIIIIIISNVIVNAIDYTNEALADEVISLPGLTTSIKFKHFSGYLPVENGTKFLHYWFVESMSDPSNDPLSFWTNGGPGFLTEQGPFRPNADGTIEINDYAWNQRTNYVFIEIPAGVGFSYATSEDGLHTNDDITAENNYELIQQFLIRFPQYKSNSLYISSESYGGHYMPTLAKKIVDYNKNAANTPLNFKGFAVGNPFTTVYSAIPSSFATYWGHQVISKPTWDKYQASCASVRDFSLEQCELIFLKMFGEMGDLNPYALDYPVCVGDRRLKYGRGQRAALLNHILGSNSKIKEAIGLDVDGSYEPCEDDYATSYMNRADVKTAIHVKGDIEWAECSRSIRYSQLDSFTSMVPIYQELLDNNANNKLKIVVYSGDDDAVCSTEGTQQWIWDMGYNIRGERWNQYKVNNQTAGYITRWENNFSFVTIRGAGHEVPTYKPEIALYLWNSYIDGKLTVM